MEMSDPFTSSTQALAAALLEELDRSETNLDHARIRITSKAKRLPNGINSCSVQVQCHAGCGWLFEDFGEKAGLLEQKAASIQELLKREVRDPQSSLSEIVVKVFPESVIQNPPSARKNPRSFIA
jgi:hypothetical protein